jgi:inhibitor of the pro-sigma K processing machinery
MLGAGIWRLITVLFWHILSASYCFWYLGRLLFVPLKVVMKLVYNALLGAVVIFLVNLAGGLFGFHMAFNIYTAFIAGTLGVPGFILLVILKLIF